MTLIALTGWGQEEDRRRSRLAGFDFHLIKPADMNALKWPWHPSIAGRAAPSIWAPPPGFTSPRFLA